MKRLGKDTFNERLKQTMFENEIRKATQSPKVIPNPFKVKVISLQKKWLRPRKMRKSEKFALASLLTYVVYMMQMAQHF